MRVWLIIVGLCGFCLASEPVWAGDMEEIQALKQQLKKMQKQLDALQQRVLAADKQKLHKASDKVVKHDEPISDEVLFSDPSAFQPLTDETQTLGWLSTFNINGNMALRYRASNNRAFNNGFTDTFRLSNFNLDFSFEPTNRVSVALGMQMFEARAEVPILRANQNFKTGGKTVYRNMFSVKYGYADYHADSLLHVRFGAFLTPFGVYNESLHTDYDSKLVQSPYLNIELVPAPWTQVGLQLYGSKRMSAAWQLDYTLYTGNGLEAPINALGVINSDRIADMTHTLVSRYNTHRAYGGRMGIIGQEGERQFELGTSAYQGAWDILARYNLTLLGLDAWYRQGGFELRGEWVTAYQQNVLQTDHKLGWYAQGAYRWKAWEPVARVDRISQTFTSNGVFTVDHRWRYTLGLNAYLSKFFILKSSLSNARLGGIPTPDRVWMMTLTAGF